MPRTKKYDESLVLSKAMLAFWEHGYKGITTRELAEAMGINPFSLYASFESKEKLFESALEHYYVANVEQQMLLPFNEKEPNVEDIRHFFEQFVDMHLAGYPPGCLVCNTMVEGLGMGNPIVAILQQYRQALLDAFQKALHNSYPTAGKDAIRKKAEFLFGATLGVLMQNKIGINGDPIQNYTNEVINAVSTIEQK